MKLAIYLLFLFVIFSITGCLSVRPGSVKSGLKYYESFYVGEEGSQYFIKPIELESTSSSDIITTDFVFRYREKTDGIVTVNYSLIGDKIIKTANTIVFANHSFEIAVTDSKLLFNEKNNDNYISRFSGTMKLDNLIELFKDNDWIVTITPMAGNSSQSYKTSKTTKKTIDKLYENVFILFQ